MLPEPKRQRHTLPRKQSIDRAASSLGSSHQVRRLCWVYSVSNSVCRRDGKPLEEPEERKQSSLSLRMGWGALLMGYPEGVEEEATSLKESETQWRVEQR